MNKSVVLFFSGAVMLAFAMGILLSEPLHVFLMDEMPPHPPRPIKEIFELLSRDLNLSDEQRIKIRAIVIKSDEEEEKYREKIHRYFEDNKNFDFDNFNEEQIRRKIRAIRPIEEELKILFIKRIFEINKVLTIEQRKKFQELNRKFMPRFKDHHPENGGPVPWGPHPGPF